MNETTLANTIVPIGLITICASLGIDYKILFFYTILLCLDFLTGIIKGVIQKNLKSTIAINGVFKKLVLILLIFSIGIAGKIVGFDNLQGLMKFSFSTLAYAELYSIIANVYTIRTGKKAKEFDAVSFVISSFLKIIEKQIRKLDNNQNKND